jgi:hypothetical protein
MTLSRAEQVTWEAEHAKPAFIAAFVLAVLSFASLFLPLLIRSTGGGDASALLTVMSQPTQYILVLAGQTVPSLLLIPVLLYMYKATKARNPALASAARVLAILGPVLFAAAGIANGVTLVDVSHDFAATPSAQAIQHDPAPAASGTDKLTVDVVGQAVSRTAVAGKADEVAVATLKNNTARQVVAGVQQAGALGIAFAMLLISLSAMRVGLVSRFVGIVGILVGVFYVLPLVNVAILQAFWLGAVGMVISNRWPNGRGPAWESGSPVPWPSAAEQRAAYEAKRAGQLEASSKPAQAEPVDSDGGESSAPRKKKKRGR